MIKETQMPQRFLEEIQEQISIYGEERTVELCSSIPDTTKIPINDKNHWLRINEVICVFVDMKDSTKLSATTYEKGTAGAYQLFTGTAVALFDKFEASYIDIKGDGAFALFNKGQEYRALCAAVTFKTFASTEFIPTIKEKTGLDLGCHLGIDQKTVLVRKIGLKRYGDRTDRQNEVWAGKPVNMAAKLASTSSFNELLVSDRFHKNLVDERALMSCGCSGNQTNQQRTSLWAKVVLPQDGKFDFSNAYKLSSLWCNLHGREFCEGLLRLDK